MTNLKDLSKSELSEQLAASLDSLADSKEKTEIQQLAHDLYTHQIELEMQNRELREAQDMLEISRNRYADLYDFAPVGYLSLDERGVIHEINLTGATLLGIERTYIIGAPFSKFLQRGEEVKFFNHLRQVFLSSDNVIDEVKLKAKGPSAITAQIESTSSGMSPLQGRFCRTIITDISERKAMEEESLRAREQAEAASLAKSQFLSRMSHELRTPLNAVIGFAQVMEMSADDTVMSEHRSKVNTIIQSGWHLLRIINDVLNLGSIEANKVELHIENVNVGKCTRDCMEIMSPLANEHNITLNYNAAACEDLTVRADPFRLKQILLNLIANAVKYNHKGGSVSVDCHVTQPGRVRIMVSDTGSGIREEDIASLFQPFSRLPERSYSVQGAGIGLSIAKQLAELMDGLIGVESVHGEGSTFWIELPEAQEATQVEAKI